MHDAPPGVLGIAVFGAGIIANDAHFRALSSLSGVAVRCVWSRSAPRAESLAARYGATIPAFSGASAIDEALAQPGVDAVVLAVPIAELAGLAARCRAAGKHVLSEKPLAHCVRAARVALAAPGEGVYGVAENYRFEAGIVAAAEAACKVRPMMVSIVAAMPMPPGARYATEWRMKPRHVGGQLLDGGVHFVAALRMLAGADVVRVGAAASNVADHLPPPDSASAALSFTNGVHGTLAVSYAAKEFVWELRVIGAAGDVVLRRVQGKPGYVLETRVDGKKDEKHFPFSGIGEEFACFVDCCRSGKTDERIDAHMAFNDLATVEAIVEAAETQQSVAVAQVEERP